MNAATSENISVSPQIEESWLELLKDEFQQDYFKEVKSFLLEERKQGHVFYPPSSLIFNAFNLCSIDDVKVVIIGQDPYHGPGQAHGLSFSVPKGVRPPPSLGNIFKELNDDLGLEIPEHGELTHWASQGVLLLNSTLTVRARTAASHSHIGWQRFTDAVIQRLSQHKENLVFLLWGRHAHAKQELIPSDKNHLILLSTHPSPFSAHRGFLGSKHFSKANSFLQQSGVEPIDWSLK